MSIVNQTFNDKQRSNLKLSLESNIGIEYHEMVSKFYDRVVQQRARHRVVMSKRCFNLLFEEYASRQGNDKDFSSLFCTKEILMSYIPNIASWFAFYNYNAIPEIIFIVDVVSDSKEISTFLDSFARELNDYLKEYDTENYNVKYSKQDIENIIKIYASIEIMVLPKGIRIETWNLHNINVLCYKDWDLSKSYSLMYNISKQLSESLIANTLNTFTVVVNEKDKEEIAVKLKSLDYTEYEYNKRLRRSTWVKSLCNDVGETVAYYTVSLYESRLDGSFNVIPYVFIGNIEINCIQEIYEHYKVKLPCNEVKDIFGIANSVAVFLNFSLLVELLRDKDTLVIDTDKIKASVGGGGDFIDLYKEMIEKVELHYTIEELNEFILKNAKALKYNSENNNALIDVLDGIYEDEKSDNKSVETLLVKGEAERVLSDIVRLSIDGFIDLRYFVKDTEIVSGYVFEDLMQLAKPKQYMLYMSVLKEIERDSEGVIEIINLKIDKLFGEDAQLCKELKEFIREVYKKGRCIADYGLNYIGWCEIDYNNYPELKEKTIAEALELTLILLHMTSVKLTEKYKEIDGGDVMNNKEYQIMYMRGMRRDMKM